MLHVTLRELVTTRGPGVLRDAEELRGALDDFLAEDEATTGEVNVLVDAVRLGALPRLLTLLDGGAVPDAAISEVGDGLARDRGSDDVRRPRWALAVFAYALGRIDGSTHLAAAPPGTAYIDRATQPLPDEAAASVGVPPPPPPADLGAPVGGVLPPPPPPVVEPTPEPEPPVPPVSPEERKRSRGALAMLLVLLLVAGAGAVAAWWWLNRDDDTSADDDSSETSSPSDEPTKKKKKKDEPLTGELPDNELVTSLLVGDEETGQEKLYRVDAETGEAKEISQSPATLPTITPDRRSVIYLVPTASGGRQLRIIDLVDETDEQLFPEGSPCEYGNRPAFSPNGMRFVVTCADSSGAGTGLYTASIGGEPTQISTLSVGAPTWGSDGFIYFFTGKEFDDAAIQRIGEAGGDPEQVTDPGSGFTYADPDFSDTGLLYLRLGERPEEGTPEGEVVYLDASGTEQLVDIGETVGHPAWSADGKSVVFLIDDSAGAERVAVTSLDDPSAWRLLDITVDGDAVDGNPTAPAWGTR